MPFSFDVENRSDIHIRPNVQVEIKNMFGVKADTLTLNSQNIFPGTARKFESTWSRKWGFGRYTATITANYGTLGKVTTGVFSFWLIPIRLILGILFLIGLLATLMIVMKKKMSATSAEKNKEIKELEEKVKKLEEDHLHSFKDINN